MPTLPKFLRCRGISSSTKTLKSYSSKNQSMENIHQSTSSLKPKSFDPIKRELPTTPESECTTSSGPLTRTISSNETEANSYRTMPVFRSGLSTNRQSSSSAQATTSNSEPSTSRSCQPSTSRSCQPSFISTSAIVHDDRSNNISKTEEVVLRNQIKKLRNLLEQQADEAFHLHNKDSLEKERLRRLNHDLMRQLKDLQLRANEDEDDVESITSDSDHGYNSIENEDSSSISTTMSDPLPNNFLPSNFRLCFEQLEVFEGHSDNPGGFRARRIVLSANGSDSS